MNALLIYPEMPDTFYAMRHFCHAVGKKAPYPPLGLLTISPMLPGEWNQRLKDLNASSLTQEDLSWADLVFISAMSVQEDSVREILSRCNEAGVTIVAGGPLFTHEYHRFQNVDHFVLNEAEITLPQFVHDMSEGKAKRIYQTHEFADITLSPLPAYDLVSTDDYLYSIVQYSRGCPYLCDFCDVTALFGRRPRVKSPDQIIRELEAINRQSNVRLILFADDNLIGNKRVLKDELLPALIEWRRRQKPGFFFATQLTINLADDEELMALLLEAGFRHVFVGVESPDEESLKDSRKNQNLKRDQLADIRKLHAAGFIVFGGFIVGFDTDTPTIFDRQQQFIQQSGIPLPIVNVLKAPPGTELHDRMDLEGRLSKPLAFEEGDTNIVPTMDLDVLQRGFLDLTEGIYSPGPSFERLMEFAKTYRYPKTTMRVPQQVSLSDVLLFFRIVLIVGIRSPYRSYFWRFLATYARKSLSAIDTGIVLGLLQYQMHKTFETIARSVTNQMSARAAAHEPTVAPTKNDSPVVAAQ